MIGCIQLCIAVLHVQLYELRTIGNSASARDQMKLLYLFAWGHKLSYIATLISGLTHNGIEAKYHRWLELLELYVVEKQKSIKYGDLDPAAHG